MDFYNFTSELENDVHQVHDSHPCFILLSKGTTRPSNQTSSHHSHSKLTQYNIGT